MTQRWNHNIHYHRLIVKAAPPEAARVLDVGCGIGMLAADLGETIPSAQVIGIDLHEPSLRVAQHEQPQARFLRADL